MAGALQMRGATEGGLITTASFTQDVLHTVQQIGNIVLIDGARLADLAIEFDIGVSTEATDHVKKVDQDSLDEWA